MRCLARARRPLFWVGKAPLTLRDCVFCASSGLRGSVSLILAQAVVTEVPQSTNPTAKVRPRSLDAAAGGPRPTADPSRL